MCIFTFSFYLYNIIVAASFFIFLIFIFTILIESENHSLVAVVNQDLKKSRLGSYGKCHPGKMVTFSQWWHQQQHPWPNMIVCVGKSCMVHGATLIWLLLILLAVVDTAFRCQRYCTDAKNVVMCLFLPECCRLSLSKWATISCQVSLVPESSVEDKMEIGMDATCNHFTCWVCHSW